MRVFLDTSVLVAGFLEGHEDHSPAYLLLSQISEGAYDAYISAHTLAECYCVMTNMPPPLSCSPKAALQIVDQITRLARPLSITPSIYMQTFRFAAGANIQGGAIYDCLHFECARNAGVERLYTFNLRDYARLEKLQDRIRVLRP